jgi:hypothetical protein
MLLKKSTAKQYSVNGVSYKRCSQKLSTTIFNFIIALLQVKTCATIDDFVYIMYMPMD